MLVVPHGLAIAGLFALARAKSTLFSGGTIIAFDKGSESLNVIRGGSLLVTDDKIRTVSSSPSQSGLPAGTETIDVTGKILTPGFIDTHRHGWQTGLKTIASNTSLIEYFFRYGEFVAGEHYTADDVYIGQLAGLYEALAAGVTTSLDHAHHTWSDATAEAGLQASIDSGARVFWAYAFHNVPNVNLTVDQQIPNFRKLATSKPNKGSPTEIGIAYDSWGPNPNVEEAKKIVALAKEFNVPVITTHALGGAWGINNMPRDVHSFGILNTTIPVVFSHASFLTVEDAHLLRSTDQYMSITPESEMHYGHTHPYSHLIMDQSALGVDTHFTYSTDILTQARVWLQVTRRLLYERELDAWRISSTNPMSCAQAFKLATRSGALALRRDDLGIIAEGAKADIVVWNGDSPALLGWRDPVAAVILHASVGDILDVMVDGKFVKRNGKLVVKDYDTAQKKFLASARRLQDIWGGIETELPDFFGNFNITLTHAIQADTERGDGTGYDKVFV